MRIGASGTGGSQLWQSIVAPAGVPAPILRKLNEEFAKAAKAPVVVRKVAAQAVEISTSSPEEATKLLRSDIDRSPNLPKACGRCFDSAHRFVLPASTFPC